MEKQCLWHLSELFSGVRIVIKVSGVADKPGSVVDSHSSGMHITMHLERPTQKPCGLRAMTTGSQYLFFHIKQLTKAINLTPSYSSVPLFVPE